MARRRESPSVFVHIGLDRFGAECLGKLSLLLDDLHSEDEQHVFAWGGQAAAPERSSYWSRDLPIWHETLDTPGGDRKEIGAGLETDRRALALAVSESVTGGTLRQQLDDLFGPRIRQLLGPHQPFRPSLILCGSLADPDGGAMLLGLLHGVAGLRSHGLFEYRVSAVMGIGHRSGPAEQSPEESRSLAARALRDLELFFGAPGAAARRAAPVYLVGEDPIQEVRSNRVTQVAIGAFALLGLTRSALEDHRELSSRSPNPFHFGVDPDSRVEWARRSYSPEHPFASVGAYGVHCPAHRLARLLAARVSRETFEALLRQESCANLEECAELRKAVPDEIDALLLDVERGLASSLWERVGETSKIRWHADEAGEESVSFFDLGRVQQLYDTVFANREWERLMAGYGRDRLYALPLEDWNAAVEELIETVEQGYLPLRRATADRLTRRVLLALRSSLDDALAAIFGRAARPPVEMLPHRTAQALLGKLHKALQDEDTHLEEEGLKDPHRETKVEDARRVADRTRKALESLLASIPSPAAVLLRTAPLLALGVAMAAVVPDGWLPFPSPEGRLGSGAILGALLCAATVVWQDFKARRRVWAAFNKWLAHYQTYLSLKDELLRDQSYTDLLRRMIELVSWYFAGEEEEPPLPPAFDIALKVRPVEEQVDDDALTCQTVVSGFPSYLESARRAFAEIEEEFLRQFQISYVETVLPEITVQEKSAGTLDEEYGAMLAKHVAGDLDPVQTFLQDLAHWCRTASGEPAPLLPFRDFGGDDGTPGWRRSFELPSGADLLDPERRRRSSGFRFLAAATRYILSRHGDGFSLPERIERYVKRRELAALGESALYRRYSNLSTPSLQAERRRDPAAGPGANGVSGATDELTTFFVIAAGAADTLATSSGWSPNDLGNGQLSVMLQLKLFLSADEVVYYPNESKPTRPLGLAWQAFQRQPLPGKAFEAVELPPEASE